MEDKIFNSNFDNVEYGTGGLSQQSISICPLAEDFYKESTTEHIEDLYTSNKIMEELHGLYEESPFFQKYKKHAKKIERPDIPAVYDYFNGKLKEKEEYSTIQIFCAIAEFFDMNYSVLYNDIISLNDKAEILGALEKQYGLEKKFVKSRKLF